jgi:hypothetical protein
MRPVRHKAVSSLASLTVVFAWAGSAAATPDFPGVVENQLGLTEVTVDPPLGCKLCHDSEQGGQGTLNAFGYLLQQNGAVAYNEASLRQALEQVNPALIADIRQGIDPNTDPAIGGSESGPQYGCSAAPSPSEGAGTWGVVVAIVIGLRAQRRARALGAGCERSHGRRERTDCGP